MESSKRKKNQEEELLAAEVFGVSAREWSWREKEEDVVSEEEGGTEKELGDAAWIDDDDTNIVVDIRKTKRLKKLRKVEKEGNVQGIDLENRLRERYATGRDADWVAKARNSAAIHKTESLLKSSKNELIDENESRLDVLRYPDANCQSVTSAVVQAIDFSKSNGLMVSAGFDKRLRLFRVDGKENPLTSSFLCKDLPIAAAAFCSENKIAASGRRPFFYLVDIETTKAQRVVTTKQKSLERFAASADGTCLAFSGPDGHILTCDPRSGLWSHTDLRINGTTRALAFDQINPLQLYAAGSDAQVYSWDLRHTRRCLTKITDPGQSITSAIAVHNNILAVASESGIVNIFRDQIFVKAISSLTTPVDRLAFHPSEDLLAISSKWTKDALRVVNLRTPVPQVYAHWPTNKTPLHYVSATAFAPHADFLAIGNDRGRVLLYQLKRPE